jgi:hypothetical protein
LRKVSEIDDLFGHLSTRQSVGAAVKFYEIEPEVDGGWGPDTEGALQERPPKVTRFNYEFDVRPTDPLIEALCTFVVTPELKAALIHARLTGITFGPVEITKSEEFEDRYPDLELPQYEWLQIVGQAGRDDFGFGRSHNLVVSETTLELLRANGVRNCETRPYTGVA